MLEVQKLSKSYGKSLAVDEVSFFVPDGTVGILLGPNGAGKIDDHQKVSQVCFGIRGDRNSGTSCQKCGGKETVCLCSGDACHV